MQSCEERTVPETVKWLPPEGCDSVINAHCQTCHEQGLMQISCMEV